MRQDKVYRIGTHRALAPEQTLERVQPWLEHMGITRVADVTGLDRVGVPVYTACRPQSRSISVSQGKGLEPGAAKVSAIMESVETWHAERIATPTRYGSVNKLDTQVPLADYKHLPRSTAKPLASDQSISWVAGKNLLDNKTLWVPLEMVSTDYTLPLAKDSGHFAANTNGLASGNTLTEAICHALYEVIERDAEALWKQQPLRKQYRSGVDPASIDDPHCCGLLEKFRQANIDVRIWNMTSDVGLPTFLCLAAGDEADWADPEDGAGCHVCAPVALARALTEAAQARATYIAGNRDDCGMSEYLPRQRQRRTAQAWQMLDTHRSAVSFTSIASVDNDSLEADLAFTLERLRAVGINQVIAVDLSLPEPGLGVAKVVVPGLEGAYGHSHGSYVPGERALAVSAPPFGPGGVT